MKKISFVLQILLIFAALDCFVFATSLSSADDMGKHSVMSHRLIWANGNDNFTLGIAKNDDDHHTFSFVGIFTYRNFSLKADLSAYTNRIAKTRYDELMLETSYKIALYNIRNFSLYLDTSAGLGFRGYMGLDAVQNNYHKYIRVASVHVPYISIPEFYPLSELGMEANYSPVKGLSFSGGASVIYSREFIFGFQLSMFYKAFGIALNKDTKWKISSYIDFGAITFNYERELDGTFGYGTVGVDVMSFFRKPTWKKSDVSLSSGRQKIQSFRFHSNYLELPFSGYSSVCIISRYTSGIPNPKKSHDPNIRVQRNHLQLAAGYRYRFQELWIFRPYCEMDFGLAKWQIDIINTDGSPRISRDAIFTPFTQIRIGTTLLPEGLICFDWINFMLEAALDIGCYPDSNLITSYVRGDSYHSEDFIFKPFCMSFFIGMKFGFDL
ncbi:MAG: hypothetical protein ACTTJW_05900 [Sphaerochaeta sp.]